MAIEAGSARRERQLLEALGITRVARLTGLDRVGVEVANAVRPLGHVLQVSNGKGRTFAQARQGAISEAAELTCAETVDPGRLRWGSARWLRSQRCEVWTPDLLGSAGVLVAPELWSEELRLAWVAARTLERPREVWVPAQAVWCPPSGVALGPAVVGWSSNGLGAHPSLGRALRHAVLEVIERDQLARSLPEGWTAPRMRQRWIVPELLGAVAPWVRSQQDALKKRGIALHLFDLTVRGRGALGLPVAAALLVEPDGPFPVTSGYASKPALGEAMEAAFLEAAQTRLTDIHGAREDVTPPDPEIDNALIAMLEVAAPRVAKATGRATRVVRSRVPSAPGRIRLGSASAAPGEPLAALRANQLEAAMVDLSRPGISRRVVKVIVPAFSRTELL